MELDAGNRVDSPAVPPLSAWTWALAFALLLGFGGFEWFFRMGPPGLTAFEKFNLDRVEEFAQRSTDADLRIVMLGNSRLKYATPDDLDLSALLSNASKHKVEVLRIVNNWAVFQDFAELLDPISDLQPDIIVLQLQLLGQQRALEARSLMLLDFIDWLISRRDQYWNPGQIDQHELQYAVPCSNDLSEAALKDRLERTSEWLSFDPGGASGRAARSWARGRAQNGAKVVILAIPRTATIEAATGVSFREKTRKLVDELVSSNGVTIAEFGDSLPDDAFCDVVHTNETGRRILSQWLVTELLIRGGLQ